MDHADWVRRNIEAVKRGKMNAADKRRLADRRGWFAAPDVLNDFHGRAFTILGVIGSGIYNAPIEWDSVYWGSKSLHLNWRGDMSTVDFDQLSTAVFLAHDAAIRFTIAPKMRWLEIGMWQRERHHEGMGFNRGHRTLTEAVARHRTRFPDQHHIHLKALEPAT